MPEVEEVIFSGGGTGGEGFGEFTAIRSGLEPAVLEDFPEGVGTRIKREGVVAVGVGDGGDFAFIEGVVGVGIDVDGPASESGITVIEDAIGIQVLVLGTGLGCLLEVAKVNISTNNLDVIVEYCECSIEHLNPVLPVDSGGGVALNPSLLKLFSQVVSAIYKLGCDRPATAISGDIKGLAFVK